jgi:hypothetical protein
MKETEKAGARSAHDEHEMYTYTIFVVKLEKKKYSEDLDVNGRITL